MNRHAIAAKGIMAAAVIAAAACVVVDDPRLSVVPRDYLSGLSTLAGDLAKRVMAPARPPAPGLGSSSCYMVRDEPADEPVDDPTAAALLAAHNRARSERGLASLRIDSALSLAAWEHAEHMAKVGRMAHSGIGDGTPASRAGKEGYRWAAIGENVAAGQLSEDAVMRAWLASPGHRANVLGAYRDFGAAVARDERGRPYWCVVFGRTSGG